MSKIISRKCEGQELANVAKLRAQFDADQRRFASGDRTGDVLSAAAGYVLGYPLFLEIIGHEWRAESERTAAYYALNAAHAGAVEALMQEAERLGIDSAPLWEYGRVCRELLADEPWKHYVGPYDVWPDCLGHTRMSLPDDYRNAIRAGEGALHRLNAKLAIESDDAAQTVGAMLRGADAAVGDWNKLTDRQRDCLRALAEAKAFNADSRLRADDVAAKAEGRGANVNGFKQPLSDLVFRGLVESKTGREGGYWLTVEGQNLVAKNNPTTDSACA